MLTHRLLTLALVGAIAASAPAAAAETGSPWDPYPDVGPADYSIAVMSGAVVFALQFGVQPLGHASTAGGWLTDDVLRDALVLEDREARDQAATISNFTWHSAELYPLLIDAGLVALLVRQDPQLAWNITVTSAAAIGLTGALTSFLQRSVGRARSLHEACDADPGYAGMCTSRQRFQSFWSGHTAMAFTGAGLTCSHAAFLDLYESEAGGVTACLTTLAVAATTGYLRMAADRHWPSDVALGAAGGFLIGFGLPWLLHYRFDAAEVEPKSTLRSAVAPAGGPGYIGLSWAGDFR